MEYYGFILGHNPILSIAEIFQRAKTVESHLNIVDLTRKALIVRGGHHFDPAVWQQSLGGTIKIVRIIKSQTTVDALHNWFTTEHLLQHVLPAPEEKNTFGFSLYGDTLWGQAARFQALGLGLKKQLKQAGYKARYIAPTGDATALSSVQVDKNKMIDRGADITIISGLYAMYLGRTVAVQDFSGYSRRDYGRPQRDAYSGMLPPKLAKIMLNISGIGLHDTLLDPFCGSGTILQEAALLGYTNIIGNDISHKAVRDTRSNIDWLRDQYALDSSIALHEHDVRNLPNIIKPASIDGIVTEPFLGPPINSSINPIDILAILQELENLYTDAFAAFAALLKPGGKVVIILPLFQTQTGIYSLKILEQLTRHGFYRENPLSEKVSLFAKIGPTARGSLIYQRPDQTVQREIFTLVYKEKSGK